MELLPCGRHCSRWEAPQQRPLGSIDFRSVCEQFCAVKSLAPVYPGYLSCSPLIFGVSSHAYGELEPYTRSPFGPTIISNYGCDVASSLVLQHQHPFDRIDKRFTKLRSDPRRCSVGYREPWQLFINDEARCGGQTVRQQEIYSCTRVIGDSGIEMPLGLPRRGSYRTTVSSCQRRTNSDGIRDTLDPFKL